MNKYKSGYGLVAHGGAGEWRIEKRQRGKSGVKEAVKNGVEKLKNGASALDVSEAVVSTLENDPTFNAGTGASLNINGTAELDASIMDGSTLNVGSVTGVKNVRNPVKIARNVMEKTDHVMLSGDGATEFARALGFDSYDPITDESRKSYKKKKENILSGKKKYSFPRLKDLLDEYPELSHGTVGAAVLDTDGKLAAATSTGGLILQLQGRVGDTPIPGAGTYATETAAASATGKGEQVMRTLATKTLCEKVKAGTRIHQATEDTLQETRANAPGELGLISIDSYGDIGVAHGTPHMPHAWFVEGDNEISSALASDDKKLP